MNKLAEFKRLVVLRTRTAPDRKLIVLRGVHTIQVPVLTNRGFEVDVYLWDGSSTTVEGLPVFE